MGGFLLVEKFRNAIKTSFIAQLSHVFDFSSLSGHFEEIRWLKKEMELFKEGVLACLLLSTGKCNVFLEEFLLHLADQNQPSAARMLDKCVASKEKWA